jgi:hypothetical protein
MYLVIGAAHKFFREQSVPYRFAEKPNEYRLNHE